MTLSFDQIRELIHQALGRNCWVVDLFADHAIYSDEVNGRTYRVDYLVGENDELALGERTEVKRETSYIALNSELPTEPAAPEWLMLIPAGEEVETRDSRSWINDSPETVVAMLRARNAFLPIDYEHATELKAPKGEMAPAAGWLEEFEVRDGAVFGRVNWTPAGLAAVTNREYRYISPVLLHDKQLRVRSLSSVALVNKPNMLLPALNFQQPDNNEEITMELAALLAKLGLPATATFAQALNAIEQKATDLTTALNREATPSLDKFVPRADFDATLTRATNAEQKLADIETATLETAINAEIDTALKAGKIPPVSKDYYLAMCRQDDGLKQFQEFIKTAPVIAADSNLAGKDAGGGGKALNAEEQQVAAMFGNSAEDLQKYGGEGSSL